MRLLSKALVPMSMFTILAGFSAQTALGVASRLDGAVYLTRSQSTFSSSSTLTCVSFFGLPESNCVFSGSHSITDTQNELPIANHSALIVLYYLWTDFASGTGEPGVCYRGNLGGSLLSTGEYWAWISGTLCVPNVSEKPPITDCPVIIDLASQGFKLSGLDDPVQFDLDADGEAEEIGWTEEGARNGFLCLDRNHDGAITDGRELFGQVTPLANGQPAKVGYVALAELDSALFGGNGDGTIGPEDMAFKDLCVWVDANHDGVSETGEIMTLDEGGVDRLDYDYIENRRQDPYGNLFRFKSKAWGHNPAGRLREIQTYDVFFVRR